MGFVAAGLLLRPLTEILSPASDLALFFSLGILFLFFLVGMDEVDISGVVANLRGRFLVASLVAFGVPFGATLGLFLGPLAMPLYPAVALAGVCALSSLGVVARVLGDLGHLREPLGLEVFTLVAITEAIGLVVVSIALEAPGGAQGLRALLVLAGAILVAGLLAWVLAVRVFPPALAWVRRALPGPQMASGLLVGGLFSVVALAERVGLHGAVVALLYGVAHSEMPHRIRAEVLPAVRGLANGLFVPLFFAGVGLQVSFNLGEIPALLAIAVVLVLVGSKALGSWLGALAGRLDRPLVQTMGLMGKGAVEMALLVVLLEKGALPPGLFSLLTLTMLAFLVAEPPLVRWAIHRARRPEHPVAPPVILPAYARYAMGNERVADALTPVDRLPQAHLPIREFLDLWVVPGQQDYVVAGEGGRLAGVVSLRRLRRHLRVLGDVGTLGDLAEPPRTVAHPDEPLDDVLERMCEHATTALPVVEDGRLVGAITSLAILQDLMEVRH